MIGRKHNWLRGLLVKYRLFRLGSDLRTKYYLLKYSIAYHLGKLGFSFRWTGKHIALRLTLRHHSYVCYTRDDRYFLDVFREILGELHYNLSDLSTQVNTVCDLGANTGVFTIYTHATYPNARYLCVEPDPRNFTYLKKNLNANHINAIAVCKAVVDPSRGNRVPLLLAESNTASAVSFSEVSEELSHFVDAIGMEALLRDYQFEQLDLLKCDIEGTELEVFRSATPELFNKVRAILVEYHSRSIRDKLDQILRGHYILRGETAITDNLGHLRYESKR